MTGGIRHDDLRLRNRALVIAAVRRIGTPSRTELANATGLSHSTISAISSDLIGEGILIEVRDGAAAVSRRGRPQIALGLDAGAASVIAVTLSLNSLSVAHVDYAGREIAQERSRPSTLTMERDQLVEEVAAGIGRLVTRSHAANRPVLRIAIAVQGVTDSGARMMLWSPITPHRELALADAVEKRFGIPVSVENDCNMIAVALRGRQPGRYKDNLVAVLLSNGIGTGLVLRGNLFTGTHSSGGEFGHMIYRPGGALCRCGRSGCIEAYAGNYAIYRHASGEPESSEPAADIDDATMLALAAAARDHEGREYEAFARAGQAIGYGLGSLFALTDPVPVALVGLGASAFDVMEPSLRRAIGETAGGQWAGDIDFDLEPDETPLIRDGSARQALDFIDRQVFAAGASREPAIDGRSVA